MSEFFNWSRISANATLKKKHLQYFNSLHWREVKKNKCVASVNLGSIHWKSEPRSYCCVLVVPFLPIFNWVFVVSTPLKILVTMGIFPKIGVKVKTSWNQHPENHFNQIRDTNFNQIQIQLLWTACNWQVFSCRKLVPGKCTNVFLHCCTLNSNINRSISAQNRELWQTFRSQYVSQYVITLHSRSSIGCCIPSLYLPSSTLQGGPWAATNESYTAFDLSKRRKSATWRFAAVQVKAYDDWEIMVSFCVHGTHSWYVNVSLVMCIYILYVVRIMNLY